MVGLVQIEELLTTALNNAPELDRQRLAQAIENFYAEKRHTWRHMQQGPYAGLLDAMVIGCDAMPGITA